MCKNNQNSGTMAAIALRLCKQGLNLKLNFHSLKQTIASWLVQRGVGIYEVSKLLDHSDIKVTKIYPHLREEDCLYALKFIT